MRTTKPIATISFNTPDFLKLKLNELLKAGRLSFWAFIVHKPEDDDLWPGQPCGCVDHSGLSLPCPPVL